MDEQIRQALADEILKRLNALSNFESGSNEEKAEIDNVVKLYKLALEDVKIDTDYDEIVNRREVEIQREQHELDKEAHEEELKKNQMKEQLKDRYFKLAVDAAEIILPLLFYATWMKRGFKFEETGIYTSTTFRGLFNRFRPTKK